jgi:uncharacterized protein with FMN-binding domain
MKKLGIFICAMMIMSLFGCNTAPKTTKTKPNPGVAQTTTTKSGVNTTTKKYKDGTYTALSDKWKYGQESATITIKGGKMIYITLRRLDLTGKEVNYNDWVGKKQANGQIKPNLKKFRLDMAKKMLTNQTYQVDTIASATVSTGGWKVAVQRALDKAK